MSDLEGEVSELYAAYVAELGAAVREVEPWWDKLAATHRRRSLKLRWPAGPAAHPRVLGVYLDYHARLAEVRPPVPPGPAPRFDDDAAWGSEAEAEPTMILPTPPRRLLIDRLQVEAEALYAKMVFLVLSPVGELPDPRPSVRGLDVVEPDPRAIESFELELRHGVQQGVERLLRAGFDLRGRTYADMPIHEASEIHRMAHHAYARDLERALHEAERWWARELQIRELRGLDREQALADLYASAPAGPAGHARVIGVIQAYWALCHEINEVIADEDRHIAPELSLLAWLRDGRHQSWVEVLTALPYWPVGVDAEGRWR